MIRTKAAIGTLVKRIGALMLLCLIWTGIRLLGQPFKAAAADLPAQMLVDTVAGQQPSPPGAGPAASAESWFSVDETLRRTTLLPEDLRWHATEPSTDGFLPEAAGIGADADRYLVGLEKQRPFRGIYFLSRAARDVDSGDSDFNYRLEWDLFKNGHYERKKDLEKKRNQNELQTLQMLNDVNQYRLNQQLDGIEFISQAVRYHQAEELAALLAGILRRRRVQLEKGYITKDDFDNIRLKYRQAEMKKKLYSTVRKADVEASLYDLLNCVEFADLIPLEQAQKAAVEQAYPLKIQQILADRARYARSWADDLSLNLYLERRNEFNDTTRNNVGFEVKIPIHWDFRRERLIDQEKRLYENQAAVLVHRIKTNLEKLYDFFAFQQMHIQMLLLELEKSTQRKSYEQERAERALEDLDYTPERSLDQIRVEDIDLRYEVIQARLKLYEILVKIAALTHAEHPRGLIAGIQKHWPAR